eukprot:CAMPEP_0171163520 /NCGR_PEP_ID=MMETSP0790-20130122/5190_1 /TAXON_ID=2925 /ORGANISM="Alexandrium catenella, Strain OF101" /LENGTH=60 /DNA_ID=CAMNT_0011628237 /DNA_START=60 /DNA_END=239 /DNA_ORIENTATION=-
MHAGLCRCAALYHSVAAALFLRVQLPTDVAVGPLHRRRWTALSMERAGADVLGQSGGGPV